MPNEKDNPGHRAPSNLLDALATIKSMGLDLKSLGGVADLGRPLTAGDLAKVTPLGMPFTRAVMEPDTAPVEPGPCQSLTLVGLQAALNDANRKLANADTVALQMAAKAAAAARRVPAHQHREAFMLMTYRTEGGAFTMRVWNSRDGVTPFQMHVDRVKYQHDVSAMEGPFYDRPEGIVAQWETRTEAAMMAAWHRSLTRAVLRGALTKEKADSMADSPDHARAHHLNIGLRSMATGKFTDEE